MYMYMHMNMFRRYWCLSLTSVSLLLMVLSCQMQYDPFKEASRNVGSMGFYVNGSPVVYHAGSASVSEIEGTDSLMISCGFILAHYDELVIRFAKADMSLDAPIRNPEIELRYLYSVFVNMSEPYGDDYEWRTLNAESAEVSFSEIGGGSGSGKSVLSGNFWFDGTRDFPDGSTEMIHATDGVFSLEVSHLMIR